VTRYIYCYAECRGAPHATRNVKVVNLDVILLGQQDEGFVNGVDGRRVGGRVGVPEERRQQAPELVRHQDLPLRRRVTNGLRLGKNLFGIKLHVGVGTLKGRNDIQHNDTQYSDTQHN
jgi:hypothetical protein